MPTLRSELEALIPRLRRLAIDKRGYPVPWFVDYVNGEPEFRAMDPAKLVRAVKERRCWTCGDILGVHLTFVIGPMCALNRTIAEPPSHYDCAAWSVRNCPFLSRPHMVRREDDLLNAEMMAANAAGIPLTRNPGAVCLWTTRGYKVYDDGKGKPLFEIGEPERVEWYAHGRSATRAEVEASIDSGLPLLEAACEQESTERRKREAHEELQRRRVAVTALLPSEGVAVVST